jgi:hypothetical protein
MPKDALDLAPVRGLPGAPPEGERILWQGAPQTWALARSACKVHWVAGYFLFLAVWRGSAFALEGRGGEGLVIALWFLAIGAMAVAILVAMAWAMARATTYTITSRRVMMQIGAALTATVNIPHQWIAAANLKKDRYGLGTIALKMKDPEKLTIFMLWPHVRPWSLNRSQPALRCIADAESVASILGAAARARIAEVAGPGALADPEGDAHLPPEPAAIAAE